LPEQLCGEVEIGSLFGLIKHHRALRTRAQSVGKTGDVGDAQRDSLTILDRLMGSL
jgi:hypothetical protein